MTGVWTAQIGYQGHDVIDTTVRAQHSFSPTWKMVMDLKGEKIDEAEYERQYLAIINAAPLGVWHDLSYHASITFVCYCKPGGFCHRVILAKEFDKRGFGRYMGERRR